jgi:hypothetical protein
MVILLQERLEIQQNELGEASPRRERVLTAKPSTVSLSAVGFTHGYSGCSLSGSKAPFGTLRIAVSPMPQLVGTSPETPRVPLLVSLKSFSRGDSLPRVPREATPSKFRT